jgi:hypothetical protein
MARMARVGWVRAAAVVALVGCTSCYDWVAIQPVDIPRFTAPPHEVEGPDGSRVRFEGDVMVKVHTSNGTLTYSNPRATIDDDFLAISGEGAAPAEIPLRAIDRAKAGQLNTFETAATIFVGLAGGVAAFVLFRYTWLNFRGVD